jgi:hypothetical protein
MSATARTPHAHAAASHRARNRPRRRPATAIRRNSRPRDKLTLVIKLARFADARGLKAYAGAAPVTRARGKQLVVLHRTVKNNRLAAVGYLWTFAALRLSTGARAHYDRRRLAGDRHAAAQRNLFNRFLGCLYHCLQTGQTYSEEAAFRHADALAA